MKAELGGFTGFVAPDAETVRFLEERRSIDFSLVLKIDGRVVAHEMVPALCTNDEEVEAEAVLAGHVIGLLTGPMATPHIRAGRLVPL